MRPGTTYRIFADAVQRVFNAPFLGTSSAASNFAFQVGPILFSLI